jgi:plasmid stabilization system protein ParE
VKWRLVIRPRAESDLREARSWYENQRAGLGTEFLAEIDTTIQILMRDPQRHPIYYRGFYRVLARRFPCVLQAGG